jgi:hypothetical protein
MTNEATPSINRINPPELGAPPAARAEVSKTIRSGFHDRDRGHRGGVTFTEHLAPAAIAGVG